MWWIKKFRKRITQSILIFIIVAMCTTLITGSAVILTSLTSVYEELAAQTNAPDVKVYSRPDFTQKDYQKDLKKTGCVTKIIKIPTVSVTTIMHDNKETDAFLDICQYRDDMYGNVRVIAGSLSNLDEKSCVLPMATAQSVGAKVGDIVSVKIEGKKYSYRIAATYAEIFSAATEYTCDMLVLDIPKHTTDSTVYATWLKDGYTCDDLIREYTKENEGILDGYFRSESDSIMNAEIAEMILGGILLGISSVVFLAILLIISYIVKNCFRTDKKTIAIYKTVGYRTIQIRRIYITFYMSIICSGTIIGAILSPILSNSFIHNVYKNIGVEGKISGLWQIVTCILVINLSAFLMLLCETRRIGKLKPVDILNGNDEEIGKKKLKSSNRTRYCFSSSAMALRMMVRDKKNTILLIVTCIVSLYIVNLSIVCLENLDLIKGETNYYWLGTDKHDVTIENNGSTDFYDICSEIKKDKDVEQTVRRNYNMGFAIPYHQSTSALVFETFENVEIPVLKGHNPKHSNEVVVGNIYLKEMGIDVGDYITVQLDETHKKDLLVVGTYQGFYNMGRGIKIMGSLLEENDIPFQYTECSITLKQGVDKVAFMKELKEKYGTDIKVIDRKNLYASIMNVICEPQRAALKPFVVISVIIGALNAFYIIYASNVEKRKKYTIYKSLGYTSGHLLKMNCIYVGTVVLISTAVAVVAFIFLFPKVMVLSMSAFGFAEYKLVIKPLTLVLTNASMLAIFILSACLAAGDLYKNHIANIMNE